jgi:hypothetical protein
MQAARIQARQDRFAMLQSRRTQAPVAAMHSVTFPNNRPVTPARPAGTMFPSYPSVRVGQANTASSIGTAATTSNAPDYIAYSSYSGSPITTFTPGSSMGSTTSAATTPIDINDVKNGPLAKAGQNLIEVYNQFETAGGGDDFTLTGPLASIIRIQGDSVGVDVGAAPGNMVNVASTLEALGMQVTATDATTGKIEGFLPIAQLPTVAQNSAVLTLAPNYYPVMPPPPTGGFQPR